MPDIKTRAVVEKFVKTIDKSAIAAQRMKNAYVQVREKTRRTTPSGEESPEGYASDKVSDSVTVTAYESAQHFDRWGRKGIDSTKENISKAKEQFQRKRLTAPLKKKAPEQDGHSPSIEQSHPRIKTFDRGRKVAEQPVKPAEKVTVKRAEGVVKSASKSVKTAGTTGKPPFGLHDNLPGRLGRLHRLRPMLPAPPRRLPTWGQGLLRLLQKKRQKRLSQ